MQSEEQLKIDWNNMRILGKLTLEKIFPRGSAITPRGSSIY